MFNMVVHMKALALAHSRLLKIIVAEQKRTLENTSHYDQYASATEELVSDMDGALRQLGVK